jgi:hypothetical protein
MVRHIELDALPPRQGLVVDGVGITRDHHHTAAPDDRLDEPGVIAVAHLMLVGIAGRPRPVGIRRVQVVKGRRPIVLPNHLDSVPAMELDTAEPAVDPG